MIETGAEGEKAQSRLSRRAFLSGSLRLMAMACLLPYASLVEAKSLLKGQTVPGYWVNDIHSLLNNTNVWKITHPETPAACNTVLANAVLQQKNIAVCGARHSMGGQQFLTQGVLLDTTRMNRLIDFDAERGCVTVEAGVSWKAFMSELEACNNKFQSAWGIRQKPTGADTITLGGSLSSNIHGRGLTFAPFVQDIQSFTLMDASGDTKTCSRSENPELFSLAIGGYGLFGVVETLTLQLDRRYKIKRCVKALDVDALIPAFDRAIAEGCQYGDYQFAIDEVADDFLTGGIFTVYQPVDADTPIPSTQKVLSEQEWADLVYLAHSNKSKAFEKYRKHYEQTDGQIYWSDTHQMGPYREGYHRLMDTKQKTRPSSELITEIYVPRSALPAFLKEARDFLRTEKASVIYGTIRLVEKDTESFLNWAREPWACIIFNLHMVHTQKALANTKKAFLGLIDLAIHYKGSFYLTYHRYASKKQMEACYPQFQAFLEAKKRYDPHERFQSDWYQYHTGLFT